MLRDAEGGTKQALSYLSDFIHIGSQYGRGSFYLHYTHSKTEAYVKWPVQGPMAVWSLLSLPFSFEKLMGLLCLFTCEGWRKRALSCLWASCSCSASLGWSQVQQVPERKWFLGVSTWKGIFDPQQTSFKAVGSPSCQTQPSFLLQTLFNSLFTMLKWNSQII